MLVCLAVLWGFVSQKQGFHMDELLSFELANAEYNPWIVPTQPEGRLARFVHNEIDAGTLRETLRNVADTVRDVLKNRGNSKLLTYQAEVFSEPVWITAEQFADYIQVDRGDAFNYLSVYFNVKDDNHPPLHFMLLHTVSSIFQGRAEAWMGCLINLAAAAALMVLLIRLGRLLAEQLGLKDYARWTGIVCALFYGLSAGAVASALLIRMYALLTLWCAAYFYLIVKKWLDREFDKKNFRLILVTVLGFWTQYFFLFYCILLAALVCVLLAREKRSSELWRFGRSMAVSALVGVAAFPFAISDVFSSGRGVEALGNLTEGFSGYGVRLWAFLKILSERTFSPFFWVLILGLAGAAVIAGRKKDTAGGPPERSPRSELIWLLALPPVGYFLLAARMSPYLVDRYVMPVFPFVILGGTLALFRLLGQLRGRLRKGLPGGAVLVICILALGLQAAEAAGYDGSYLYRNYDIQLASSVRNASYPCICVYDGVGYYENLQEFTHYEKTLLLTFEELENRRDKESIRELESVAVLVKESVSFDVRQVLDIFEEQYGFVPEGWGWRDAGAHGDTLIFMGKDV